MMQNPHYDDSLNKGPKGDPGPAGTLTTPTADVSFGNHKITNLGHPKDGGDAVNKNFAENRYLRQQQNLNLGSYWIASSHVPATPVDLTNKAYVDKLRLNIKTHTRTFDPAWRLTTTTVSQTHNLSVNYPKYFCCVIARSANKSNRQAIMLPDITNDTFLVNLGDGASFTLTLVNTHIYATLSGTVGVEITEFRIYYYWWCYYDKR